VRLWRTGKPAARDCLLEAFKTEARAMGVRHPNLISVLDLGFDSRCVYIVTDLVDSISLRTLLSRKGALPEKTAVDLVAGLADALRALHEKGIFSGGMSPETLRVTLGRHGPEKLLLAPLGLATPRQVSLLASDGPGATRDRCLDYMSPEQRAGQTPDARSDLYSLALVLYEMLGGGFGRFGDDPTPRSHASGDSAGPPVIDKDAIVLPDHLWRRWTGFFGRALDPDPDGRFPGTMEFLSAMPKPQASASIAAPPAVIGESRSAGR
jgi:serine/threonine-protein kinase